MKNTTAATLAALVERFERGAWLRPPQDEIEAAVAVLRASPGVGAALRRRRGLRAFDEARATGGTHLDAERYAARRLRVTVAAVRKWRLERAREVTKAPVPSQPRPHDGSERRRT